MNNQKNINYYLEKKINDLPILSFYKVLQIYTFFVLQNVYYQFLVFRQVKNLRTDPFAIEHFSKLLIFLKYFKN